MAEETKVNAGVADNDPVPYFRIGSQTFHTGIGSFEPGTVIPWEVPEGWNAERNGKHYAAHGPSLTWEPLNKAARKIMDAHKEFVKKRNEPKPDPAVERLARIEESLAKSAEAQATQTAALVALLEKMSAKK